MTSQMKFWLDDTTGVTILVAPLVKQSAKCQGCNTHLIEESMAVHVTPASMFPPHGIKQTFGNGKFCSKACLLRWLKEAPSETYPGFIIWVDSLPIPL